MVFAIRHALIEPIDGKSVFENVPHRFKSDAMSGVVRGGLDVVPFERFIINRIYCLAVVFCQDIYRQGYSTTNRPV
jgi:hypothetical protein